MSIKEYPLIKILLMTGFLLALGYLVSQSIGLGAGGFDSEKVLTQFNFYVSGAIFLLITAIFAVVELYIKRGDAKYGNSVAYTDQGEYPALSIFKKLSAFKLFFGSMILFSSLGLVALVTKQESFTGFKVLEHQFTPIGSITFSAVLIPIAENAGAMALIALSFFGLRYYARKYNWSSANFRMLAFFLIPLFVGLYGYVNHLLRYGSSETSKAIVFIFWYIGGFITVLTGSCIPFLVMHLDNNLLFDLKTYYSSDLILIVSVSIIAISTTLFLFIKSKKSKNNINNI